MPKHNEPQYKTKANAKGVIYAYTRVDGRQVALGRAGEAAWDKYLSVLDEWRAHAAERAYHEGARLTVGELAERYLDYELERANEGLVHRTTYLAARAAVEAAHRIPRRHARGSVWPKALGEIQRRLVHTLCKTRSGRHRAVANPPTLSRTEVNRRVNGIRRLRWREPRSRSLTDIAGSRKPCRDFGRVRQEIQPPVMAVDPAVVRATQEQLRKDGHEGMASVIELLRWTACRPSEVCTITAGDLYETDEGLEIRLGTHKTKKHTGTERVIPLNDRAAEIVQRALLDGRSTDPNRLLFTTTTQKPITSNGLYQAIRRAARHAGLPHWTAYQLRHLATEMLDAGCSEAEALGHDGSHAWVDGGAALFKRPGTFGPPCIQRHWCKGGWMTPSNAKISR